MTDHQRISRLVESGPDPDSPTRFGVAARISRRLVLRVLHHLREHQRRVDLALLERLVSLERGLKEAAVDNKSVSRRLDRLERDLEDVRHDLGQVRQVVSEAMPRQEAREWVEHLAVSCVDGSLEAISAGWRPQRNFVLGALRDAPEPRPKSVLLETDAGSLLYPAEDSVVTPAVAEHGRWEPRESELLSCLLRPGMTFFDIGAHVGYFTLLGARLVGPSGRVVALEPAEDNFRLLYENVMQAAPASIEIVRAAAWRQTTTVRLRLSSTNTGDHRVSDSSNESLVVPAFALDDIVPPSAELDVVKIDAQGRDHLVVEGMQRVIARSRPVLLVEFWPEGIADAGHTPAIVLDLYRRIAMRIEVLDAPSTPGENDEAVISTALSQPGGYTTLVLTHQDTSPVLAP